MRAFKRQHILAAARRIFGEKGLDGLNMRTIAREAGYSLGAAYAYFRTKEEIEFELLAAVLGDLTRHIRTAVAAGKNNPDSKLTAFSLFADYFRTRPEERRLLLVGLSGLGGENDKIPPEARKELDGRLLALMGLLANNLHRESTASPARAQDETMDFVAFILGALLLENAGRLQLLNQDFQEMVDRYGQRMLLRTTQ